MRTRADQSSPVTSQVRRSVGTLASGICTKPTVGLKTIMVITAGGRSPNLGFSSGGPSTGRSRFCRTDASICIILLMATEIIGEPPATDTWLTDVTPRLAARSIPHDRSGFIRQLTWYRKGVDGYRKAVEQGDADGQFKLGVRYEQGEGQGLRAGRSLVPQGRRAGLTPSNTNTWYHI